MHCLDVIAQRIKYKGGVIRLGELLSQAWLAVANAAGLSVEGS